MVIMLFVAMMALELYMLGADPGKRIMSLLEKELKHVRVGAQLNFAGLLANSFCQSVLCVPDIGQHMWVAKLSVTTMALGVVVILVYKSVITLEKYVAGFVP